MLKPGVYANHLLFPFWDIYKLAITLPIGSPLYWSNYYVWGYVRHGTCREKKDALLSRRLSCKEDRCITTLGNINTFILCVWYAFGAELCKGASKASTNKHFSHFMSSVVSLSLWSWVVWGRGWWGKEPVIASVSKTRKVPYFGENSGDTVLWLLM